MELQGTHQFKAPLPAVWDALLDPTVLSKAMPGGDQLERVGENDYKAAMNVRVGPVQGRFEGQVTLTDIVEHQSYHMKVSGTGAPGFLNGEGKVVLTGNAEGTLLTYSGNVNVGGRIAAVGQRLIDSTAKSIIRQGFKALDDQLSGEGDQGSRGNNQPPIQASGGDAPGTKPSATEITASSSAAPTSTSTDSPSVAASARTSSSSTVSARATEPPPATAMAKMTLEIAKDVVQDLTSDYVPQEKQPQLFAFISGALAMLGFVLLVRMVQRN